MSKLFLSPHADDEILFGAFTLMRERPVVAIVFDSYVQPMRGYKDCSMPERRQESQAAAEELGMPHPRFLAFSDASPLPRLADMQAALSRKIDEQPEAVYAPAVEEGGHVQHNWLGAMAEELFPGKVRHYMTYTNRGKSTGVPVPFEPRQLALKLRALACFESQIALKDNVEHFVRDQREYYQC